MPAKVLINNEDSTYYIFMDCLMKSGLSIMHRDKEFLKCQRSSNHARNISNKPSGYDLKYSLVEQWHHTVYKDK